MFTDGQKSVLIGLVFIITIGSMMMINKEINIRRPYRPEPKVTQADVIGGLVRQRDRLVSDHNSTSSVNQRQTSIEAIKVTDAAISELLNTLGPDAFQAPTVVLDEN